MKYYFVAKSRSGPLVGLLSDEAIRDFVKDGRIATDDVATETIGLSYEDTLKQPTLQWISVGILLRSMPSKSPPDANQSDPLTIRGIAGGALKFAVYVILTIALFAALNLLLVGAQHIWHWSDHSRLDDLKTQIARDRIRIREEANRVSYEHHAADVAAINQKIQEANALSQKIGGTWYIVPTGRRRDVHHEAPVNSRR